MRNLTHGAMFAQYVYEKVELEYKESEEDEDVNVEIGDGVYGYHGKCLMASSSMSTITKKVYLSLKTFNNPSSSYHLVLNYIEKD